MPKLTVKSKNAAYEEYTECSTDITNLYPEIQKYLQHHFGIHRGKLYIGDDPGGESVYLSFKGNSYWLFEVDEFTSYFFGDELHEHISNRLSKAYDQIAKKHF